MNRSQWEVGKSPFSSLPSLPSFLSYPLLSPSLPPSLWPSLPSGCSHRVWMRALGWISAVQTVDAGFMKTGFPLCARWLRQNFTSMVSVAHEGYLLFGPRQTLLFIHSFSSVGRRVCHQPHEAPGVLGIMVCLCSSDMMPSDKLKKLKKKKRTNRIFNFVL